MINFEKYKEQVLNFIGTNSTTPAKMNGELARCGDVNCADCDFNSSNNYCDVMFIEWLYKDDGTDCSPDAGKPKGECKDESEAKADIKNCSSCKHSNRTSDEYPCSECRRSYPDQFELKPKKTRQSEFLKAYPNAKTNQGIIDICPGDIDKDFDECKNYSIGCCVECQRDYWLQEVE